MKLLLLLVPILIGGIYGLAGSQPKIQLLAKTDQALVEVRIDGELFTSFRYGQAFKKPVLWPLISANGAEITRCFPLKDKDGERHDHPHHIGVWFNYGDVNGIDFWNNSSNRKAEKAARYGSIVHESIERSQNGDEAATLITQSAWQDYQGKTLIKERTHFRFWLYKDVRIIDRRAELSALLDSVKLTDNKEGMFAIRVTTELELPDEKNEDKGANGDYLSSEGLSGAAVWGSRASWMKLEGVVAGKAVAVVIYDHPDNPAYPTHWHARGYGLFAANPLGQKVFSKGALSLNYHLLKGEKATFQYRLAVFSHHPSVDEIKQLAFKTNE